MHPSAHPSAHLLPAHVRGVRHAGGDGLRRDAVGQRLADRHPAWQRTLRRALNALELLDGTPRDDTVPAAVGPELADGAPRFLIGDRIAKGSGGSVHRCIDRLRSDGSLLPVDAGVDHIDEARGSLVVKLLPHTPRSADPWHPEARLAAKLATPCGIRIVDSGDAANGAGYIVMERVDGLTLSAIAAAESPIDPLGILNELALLAMALSMLHAQGLGHGDITLIRDGPMRATSSPRRDRQTHDFCRFACARGRRREWVNLSGRGPTAKERAGGRAPREASRRRTSGGHRGVSPIF